MDILNYKEETLVLDIDEGINDPGIFKAIVLAGGPGSGKSVVAAALGLGSMGLRVVNSDMYFTHLMKRRGLSLKMPASEFEDREVARLASKVVTDKRLTSLVNARLGVIIDSTSGDQNKTKKIITMLRKSGYDVKVVFIDAVIQSSWKQAQDVKKLLKTLAGSSNYHEVDNNKDGRLNVSALAGKLTGWASRLNSSALEWIAAVKRGQDSMKTEDINTNTMKSFKEFKDTV